ncbi:hypothetical protein NC651_032237 [Populus alba x Populus x berolinensis]|nr:hypothetical protein NC651_032237 [Populus alba x Populus x berolinensis]
MDEARSIFDLMVSKGCTPNVYTYTSLMNGYCKIERIEEAVQLLDETLRKGRPLAAQQLFRYICAHGHTPNIMTYGVLLDGLCKHGNLEEAFALFQEMQRSTVKPNLVIYTILIDSLCKCGKLKDGKELFSRLIDEGLKPNVYTYTALVGALCKEGLIIEAHKLFRKMEEDGCTPDKCAYNVIIQGFLQHKDPSMARQLVEEMSYCFTFCAVTEKKLKKQSLKQPPKFPNEAKKCRTLEITAGHGCFNSSSCCGRIPTISKQTCWEELSLLSTSLMFYREIGWPYFIMGISASGQQRPMMEARASFWNLRRCPLIQEQLQQPNRAVKQSEQGRNLQHQ